MCDCSVDPSERLLLLTLRNNASPDFPLIQTMIIHSTLPSEIVSTSILIFHVYNNLETEFSRYYYHGGKNRDRNLGGISLLSQGEEKTRNEPKYPIFRHHLSPGAHAEGGQAVMRQERGSLSRGRGRAPWAFCPPPRYQGCEGKRRHPQWGQSAVVLGILHGACPAACLSKGSGDNGHTCYCNWNRLASCRIEVGKVVGRGHKNRPWSHRS